MRSLVLLTAGIGAVLSAAATVAFPQSSSGAAFGGAAAQIAFQGNSNSIPSDDGAANAFHIELPLSAELQTSNADGATEAKDSYVERMILQHSSSSSQPHLVLSHADFPQMKIRIRAHGDVEARRMRKQQRQKLHPKKHGGDDDGDDAEAFCDPNVQSWSGYIDTIDGKSLFFYFFESRKNPSKDPVLLWTNGGPGGSSSIGLFQELGPCRVPLDDGGQKQKAGPPIRGTTDNPYSWTNEASIIFIDQPVGVGFSYSRYGVEVDNADVGAKDLYRFLRIFFSAFDRFAGNDFYLSGESYGGRYIPRYAAEVSDRNNEIKLREWSGGKKVGRGELINLKGILVGNGLTDTAKQMYSYYEFLCQKHNGYGPQYSIEQCYSMYALAKRCDVLLQKYCRDTYDASLCTTWMGECMNNLFGPFSAAGRNPYDIRDRCEDGIEPDLCYNIVGAIRRYLDRDDVRKLIGAASRDEIGNFSMISYPVYAGFARSGDWNEFGPAYVQGLLENDIRVLIYVGDVDAICNWIGNKRWVWDLEWTGQKSFLEEEKTYKWIVDGQEAGEARGEGLLTWATIKNAGHMVPYDQPERSMALLRRWLSKEKI